MDPRQNQEQIGLFPALSITPATAASEAIRLQAAQSRDAATGTLLRRGFGAVGKALSALGSALVTWPERLSTYEKLSMLTDRELADIGLTRGDISHVFDPDFRAPEPAANANQAQAAARPQAA